MHLRSVLKDSPVWDALVTAWQGGATVAGSSAGAMVLCDPMVDPRGGALTLGLGLLEQLAVIPHHDTWSEDKAKRTLAHRARRASPSSGVDERTALIRDACRGVDDLRRGPRRRLRRRRGGRAHRPPVGPRADRAGSCDPRGPRT